MKSKLERKGGIGCAHFYVGTGHVSISMLTEGDMSVSLLAGRHITLAPNEVDDAFLLQEDG
jgi:hypothetical protein